MKNTDKKSLRDCTKEEIDRLVGAFAWLIKEDKKQNPHLYKLDSARDTSKYYNKNSQNSITG